MLNNVVKSAWFMWDMLDGNDKDFSVVLDVEGSEVEVVGSGRMARLLHNKYATRVFECVGSIDRTEAVAQFNAAFDDWLDEYSDGFARIYLAMSEDYKPLENYDRMEDKTGRGRSVVQYGRVVNGTAGGTNGGTTTSTRTGSVEVEHGETLTRTGSETLAHGDTLTRTGSETLEHGDTLTRTGSETVASDTTFEKRGNETTTHNGTLARTGSDTLAHGRTETTNSGETTTVTDEATLTETSSETYQNLTESASGADTTVKTGGTTTENYKSGMNAYDVYTKDTKQVATNDSDTETHSYGKALTKSGTVQRPLTRTSTDDSTTDVTGTRAVTEGGSDTTTHNTTDTTNNTDALTFANRQDVTDTDTTTTYNSVKDAHSGTDTTTYNGVVDAHSGSDTTTYNSVKDAHSGTDTTTYDSVKDVVVASGNDSRTTSETNSGSDATEATDSYTLRAHGNIGVTTSQQMLEAEIALRLQRRLSGIIVQSFVDYATCY